MPPCSSWCEQSITTFIKRIWVILTCYKVYGRARGRWDPKVPPYGSNGPCNVAHGFQSGLETFQKFAISHLSANTTNINFGYLWVSLSQFHLFFSICLQMTLATHVLKSILKTLQKFEISCFGYKWPWQEFSRPLNIYWGISKKNKKIKK
jgi:hypothetical protein